MKSIKTTRNVIYSLGLVLMINLPIGLKAADNVLTYAGNSGKETFFDVVELSNQTFLVAGSSENMNWLPGSIPKNLLNNPGITNPTPTGRYGFVIQLAADFNTILAAVYLPQNAANNIRFIKTTNVPGATTGTMYISGEKSDGYFIGKLNNNFVNGLPTGLLWIKNVSAATIIREKGMWDVTSGGDVFYCSGEPYGYNWADVTALKADGTNKVVSNWRTHWLKAGGEVYGTLAELGLSESVIEKSGIVLKKWGRGDLRSWTQADYDAVTPDGNGGTKKGKWPLDVLYNSPWDQTTQPTGGPGYTGYKSAGTPVYGPVTVSIDRRNNNMYFGMNTKSVLPGGNPDFEPAVFAMNSTGTLLWWSRLYHEVTPDGEERTSTPDQYVDYLAVDYSRTASNSDLVVLARCHGNNVENFWEGNTIAANPSASAYQNRFTGTSGNIHISWLGKLKLTTGQLMASTYVAEYADNMSGTSGTSSDPNMDGWPSPNAGWPEVNTTRCNDLSIGSNGNICVTCVGRRTVTTAGAHQKMVKASQGVSTWNYFVREYQADLSALVYSSLITGQWNTSTGAGGGNTNIYGVLKSGNNLIAVGSQSAGSDNVATGNPIPVTNVPGWGASTPQNESAIFAKFPVSGGSSNSAPSVSVTQPANNATVNQGSNVVINASASDADGSIVKVEFYNGSTKLGEDASSPYSYTWTSPATGTYSITAKAIDNGGASKVSSAVSIQVVAATGKAIPGKIEAEAYDAMSGIQTQGTSDAGGGQNVGWVNAGDWMEYNVNVASAGTYTFNYRVASTQSGRKFRLQTQNGSTVYHEITVPQTGGWQSWTTVSATATLPAGTQILRIYAVSDSWNINWMEAVSGSVARMGAEVNETIAEKVLVYPTVTSGSVTIANAQHSQVSVMSLSGNVLMNTSVTSDNQELYLNAAPGMYILKVMKQDGSIENVKVIKQ